MDRTRTYVVGHLNPDTDCVAAAVGYAWLLGALGEGEVVGARAGALNPQTRWLLERIGLPQPPLLSDAAPRFESVLRPLPSLRPESPLAEAMALSRGGSVVPLVAADGRPAGLVTGRSVFAFLSRLLGPARATQSASLEEIFARPCSEAAEDDALTFQAGARLTDARPRVLRDERDDFLVVDERGRYLGVCRKPDLLDPPRLRLVLVDHNEPGQAVAHLDQAELLEVVDHHRLANPPTRLPIRFHIDPVGSTSTLIAERIEESRLAPPPSIRAVLLGGLFSDTLVLQSPTTTDRDRRASELLGEAAFAPGAPLHGEDAGSFGRALLEAGAGLHEQARQVAGADLKSYESGPTRFVLSQVEVTDFGAVARRLPELREELDHLREQRGVAFAMLMITNVVEAGSRLLLSGEVPCAELPYPRLPDGTLDARGVVSRKKQLLPLLLALLEGTA